MQALAAWLVARPQNAVLGLAVTLLLPAPQLTSGVIMVLLVLHQGTRLAVIEAAIAGAVLAAVSLVVGAPVMQVVVDALSTWLPALVLGTVLVATRSMTLTMQLSALIAAVAMLGFHVVVDDLTVFWEPVMTFTLEWARVNGLVEQAQVIESSPGQMAHALTVAFVLWGWTKAALFLFFGNRLAMVEPHKAGPAIARAAQREGAAVLTACAVRGVETEGGRVPGSTARRPALSRVRTRSGSPR